MPESENLHVGILDFLTITSELIELDIIIQNNECQVNSSEGYNKKLLQLKLRNNIFRLLNIKNKEITIEAEDWYFLKIREPLSKEALRNEKDLKDKSVEILRGLDSFRTKEFRNKQKNIKSI
jgi:hypothetical protein